MGEWGEKAACVDSAGFIHGVKLNRISGSLVDPIRHQIRLIGTSGSLADRAHLQMGLTRT